MPRYSDECKAAVLKKLLPPDSRSVASVAAEEGISGAAVWLAENVQSTRSARAWEPQNRRRLVSAVMRSLIAQPMTLREYKSSNTTR